MTIGLSEKTINNITNIIENKKCLDWKPDTEDKRYIKYKCHCGKDGRTLKQGIVRPEWNGCSECSKKKTSNEVKENIIKIIEEAGYEFVSIEEGRNVNYKCKHGSFHTHSSNCQRGNFRGNCNICKYQENEEKDEKILKEVQESVPILLERGEWYSGRHQGGITETATHIKVTFHSDQGGNSKSFGIKQYGRDRAMNLASNYRIRESIKRQLSKNRIRSVKVVSHPVLPKDYEFLEIFLSDEKCMMFEKEHYDIIKDKSIYLFRGSKDKTEYAKMEKALLHRIFYPEFTEVDHIDRNGLNNLRFNVREGADKVNANNKSIQINNKSGVTGVIFEDGLKSRWKAQWNDSEGNKKTKSFSINKYGEKAFIKACEFREKNHQDKLDKIMNVKKEESEKESKEEEKEEEESEEDFKAKEYVFPSGRTELCKGYEPMCFDLLLKDGYKEDDLVVGYKGRDEIWYNNPITGNKSRYFPDGFILSDNAILEVKSEYYYNKEYDKNMAKFKAATAMGLNVHVYIFNNNALVDTEVHLVS